RAAHGGNARALGIPLVPANLHANARVSGIEIRETEIAGREIKFFVVERVVGDVHFAVFAEESAVGIEHTNAVVINAGSASLKNGGDDRDFAFFGNLREF